MQHFNILLTIICKLHDTIIINCTQTRCTLVMYFKMYSVLGTWAFFNINGRLLFLKMSPHKSIRKCPALKMYIDKYLMFPPFFVLQIAPDCRRPLLRERDCQSLDASHSQSWALAVFIDLRDRLSCQRSSFITRTACSALHGTTIIYKHAWWLYRAGKKR